MIEAQDQLNKLKVADWPNTPSKDRKKIIKQLEKSAFQKEDEKVTVLSNSDLQKILRSGNG